MIANPTLLEQLRTRLKSRQIVNMAWTAAGAILPLLAALITIPYLISSLGVARFGILSLAWIVVGYFGLFDMGLGKAITQLISQKIGEKKELEIPSLVWLGLILMIAFGILSAVVFWLVSPWLVYSKLSIPDNLKPETLSAFYILAFSIPVIVLTTGLRGILEAYQRFDIVNILRVPLGTLMYLSSLATLYFSNNLTVLVAVLVVVRTSGVIIHSVVCWKIFPQLTRRPVFQRQHIKQLFSFGGWMTLSNIAGPLLLYLGRLALIVLVSAEAMAYFATPYDVMINLLIIPGIFVSVLFPSFAQHFRSDYHHVRKLYLSSLLYVGMVMAPIVPITIFFAKPALAIWIDPQFAEHSYRVAQILVVGIFINSFGHISQAFIQASGRPDLTSILHVLELILYVPYLWWLVAHYGIEGAAISWLIRVSISTVALWLIANWQLSKLSGKHKISTNG